MKTKINISKEQFKEAAKKAYKRLKYKNNIKILLSENGKLSRQKCLFIYNNHEEPSIYRFYSLDPLQIDGISKEDPEEIENEGFFYDNIDQKWITENDIINKLIEEDVKIFEYMYEFAEEVK